VNDGIGSIDASFINVGEVTARGVDLTTLFGTDIPFLLSESRKAYLTWSTSTAYQLEQEEQVAPSAPRDDNVGEIGSPKLRFNNTLGLGWNNLQLTLQSRLIGSQEQDLSALTDFSVYGRDITGQLTRPVSWVDDQWLHNIALTYVRDNYSLTIGVNNIADEEPPLVDYGVGAPNNTNAVTGSGYDLFGRSFFASARVAF
jgi:iron complex outermembrane receptor protein